MTALGDGYRARYQTGATFETFLEHATANVDLWRTIYRLARTPEDILHRAAAVPGTWHLFVLLGDWCGDAVNTVPHLARLVESLPSVDLRVFDRDCNPDIMDAHLTGTSRSIPVVIALDHDFRERGWWGPRPSELQAWILGEGRALERAERYRRVRAWYARDGGRSTLEEVITLLERTGTASRPADTDVPE